MEPRKDGTRIQITLIILTPQTLGEDMVSINKGTIMKTEKISGKNTGLVCRKDGKTPDLRYKSSRDYVSQQLKAKNKKTDDRETADLSYAGFRDHAFAQHAVNPVNIPVQIKPAGKKPLWKTSN